MNIFSSLEGNGFDEAFYIYYKKMTEIFDSDEFKNAKCAEMKSHQQQSNVRNVGQKIQNRYIKNGGFGLL